MQRWMSASRDARTPALRAPVVVAALAVSAAAAIGLPAAASAASATTVTGTLLQAYPESASPDGAVDAPLSWVQTRARVGRAGADQRDAGRGCGIDGAGDRGRDAAARRWPGQGPDAGPRGADRIGGAAPAVPPAATHGSPTR